jgi:hypothetical protein
MRCSPLVLLTPIAMGCAGSRFEAPGPEGPFQRLDGLYEVQVRSSSRQSVPGILAISSSDTARGVYYGEIELDDNVFTGNLIATTRGTGRVLLEQEWLEFTGRSANHYATLSLQRVGAAGFAGKVTIHSQSCDPTATGMTDQGWVGDITKVRAGAKPTSPPPSDVPSLRCVPVGSTLRAVRQLES